jgi:hypothetical protein
MTLHASFMKYKEILEKAYFLVGIGSMASPSSEQVRFSNNHRRFTSKDDRLHITFSEWESLLTIFWDNKKVFEDDVEGLKFQDKLSSVWLVSLETEYNKRKHHHGEIKRQKVVRENPKTSAQIESDNPGQTSLLQEKET